MDFIDDIYDVSFEGIKDDVHQFRFISSVGGNEIIKIVSLTPIKNWTDWFNLGFGNLEQDEKGNYFVNDISENNNNDFDKVLATVFSCLMQFLNTSPDSKIIFFGNTEHKHATYKRKIAANIAQLQEYFFVQGGYADVDVKITEKEQMVKRKTKDTIRKIRVKDTNNMKINEITGIEVFNPQKSKVYTFVLIALTPVLN